MKLRLITILALIFLSNFLAAQTSQNIKDNDLLRDEKLFSDFFKLPKFDSRRINGLVYSSFVPGSGQIYLGHKTKGALFAVSFFTGLVGSIVSQNNFVGNRERLETLKFDYLNADRYTLAEYYWKQMLDVHNEQKIHERARNIFAIATAIIWSTNLIDYLFFTNDKGPIEFSSNYQNNNFYTLLKISVPIN